MRLLQNQCDEIIDLEQYSAIFVISKIKLKANQMGNAGLQRSV